ncbi:acyl-CoA dehydrogenase NM domain-like protein, partial [Atractiella rhizophila]
MSLGVVATRPYKPITREEVAKHNKRDDCWIIIDTYVYDITSFIDMHPGGAAVLLDATVAGKDSTDSFFGLHRAEVLEKYPRLIIGRVPNESTRVVIRHAGELSRVPHAEPLWLTPGYHTPYYNDSHRAFHKALRKIFDEKLRRKAWEIEESGKWDLGLLKEMSEWHFQRMRLGPGSHMKGIILPGDLKGEDYNYFHELIFTQEIGRMGARTMFDGFVSGLSIGLSTIYNYASQAVKDEVMEPCLRSDKYICLAITEAFMGSDVAGIRTTAEKTPDGKHWIINGTKKWITNGMFADYFATCCKTGPNGHLTMILVKR